MLTRERWQELKQRLASKYPFVETFTTPVELEVRTRLKQKPPYPYSLEPLLFDDYINDVADSLDRCLSYRREARDLELAGVKAALDYDHYIESRPVEQQLEQLGLALEAQRTRAEAIRSALERTDPKASNVDRTFYEYLVAEQKALAPLIDSLTLRFSGTAKKWDLSAKLQEDFHARYVAPGNAHNYPERYDRVVDIYTDEIYEAIAKANAIEEGLQIVFGLALPPPNYNDSAPGFLDKIVIWARDIARFLHHHNEISSTYDVIVPLVQPWRADPAGPFIQPDEFKRDMKADNASKVLTFDFHDVLFSQNVARVVGIGLSFGYNVRPWVSGSNNDVTWRDVASGYRIRATIHTPAQKKANGAYLRPPVLLGNVALHAADAPVAWHDGTACRNINPLGTWTVVVEDRLVWFDAKEHKVSEGFFSLGIPDIKLHLRIKSEIDPSAHSGFSK